MILLYFRKENLRYPADVPRNKSSGDEVHISSRCQKVSKTCQKQA